jgi:hypothetical protein
MWTPQTAGLRSVGAVPELRSVRPGGAKPIELPAMARKATMHLNIFLTDLNFDNFMKL